MQHSFLDAKMDRRRNKKEEEEKDNAETQRQR
jgi:hypothetical protein